jgi:hypothetical protein
MKLSERLTLQGKTTIGTGAILFGGLEGLYHMGNTGFYLASAGTILAFLHGTKFVRAGGYVKDKIVVSSSQVVDQIAQVSGQIQVGSTTTRTTSQSTITTDATILIGTDTRGKDVRRTWAELKSILILGLPGGGKSSTASWLVAQCIRDGASIILIDKHGRSDESLTAMLSPFESFFLQSPAYRPEDAFKSAKFVSQELENRIEGDSPCESPLVLVIDEFSDIMRQVDQGGKWQKTGQELVSLIEEINTQGRKYKVFVVAIGQIANASRSGGTEIRDLFNTRIIHGMRESQATILRLNDYKQDIANLEKGQVFLDMEGKDEPFKVQIPYLPRKEMMAIASQCQDRIIDSSDEWQDVKEDSDYEEDEEIDVEEEIVIGKDNRTKQDVTMPKQLLDLLVRLRASGKLSGFREIQELIGCTETHARNINKLVDENCETGR